MHLYTLTSVKIYIMWATQTSYEYVSKASAKNI